MSELEQALSKLEMVQAKGTYYQAKCPCHQDDKPSLSLSEHEGKLLIYCHAGCSFIDIIKALDIQRERTIDSVITAQYDYVTANGQLVYQVLRYEPKNFRQRRPDGQGGWIWDLKGITPILYNLPAVLAANKAGHWIVWVEGEKDADNLKVLGIPSTTTSGGASGKFNPDFIQYMIGAKVAIIPDNDTAGFKYANRVAESLTGYADSVKIIELPNLPPKGDFSDWITVTGNGYDKLVHLITNAPVFKPKDAVTRDEFLALQSMVKYLNSELKKTRAYRVMQRKDGV